MPCNICLETLTFTVVIELDCGHVMHLRCLKKMLKTRMRKCPQCRGKISWYVDVNGYLRKKYL